MSTSKIFIPKFVSVVQMKDTKHIRRDFHSVTLVMPQGWHFGALGVPRWAKKNFFQTWSCGISSSLDKQRICVNTQLKSSKKQLKLNVCVPKSNSVDHYAITCDIIAYHLVYFVSICVIYKCQSGIDFFSSERTV